MVDLRKAFAGILGDTRFELSPQGAVVHLLTDQHQLVLAFAIPVAVINGEAFASQMKNMALFAFDKPKDALGTKNALGQLIVEEVLKFAKREGSVTAE